MPIGKFVSVSVFVNGKKLPENDNTIDVDLHGPTSFTLEEDGQKYPVVPFNIELRRVQADPVWVTVFLDGQTISSRPLTKVFTVNGVKVGDEIRELLFTLPRIAEDQVDRNPLGFHAGKLRVEVKATRSWGEKLMPVFVPRQPGGDCPAPQHRGPGVLKHLTKRDVKNARCFSGGVVSREGRRKLTLVKTSQMRRSVRYDKSSKVLEDLILNYRLLINPTTAGPTLGVVPKQEVKEPINDDPLEQTSSGRPALVPTGNLPASAPPSGSDLPPLSMNLQVHDPLNLVSQTEDKEDQENMLIPLDQIKRRESGLLPLDGLKCSESEVPLLNQLKDQENPIMVVNVANIKKRESCMLPVVQIQSQGNLIPKDEIKRRESDLFPAAPVQQPQIWVLPPDQIKKRESSQFTQWQNNRDPGSMLSRETSQESGLGSDQNLSGEDQDDSVIVITDSDYEGDDVIYSHTGVDDSVVYMGDDDCCVLDVSNNVSLIDLEGVDEEDFLVLDLNPEEDMTLDL